MTPATNRLPASVPRPASSMPQMVSCASFMSGSVGRVCLKVGGGAFEELANINFKHLSDFAEVFDVEMDVVVTNFTAGDNAHRGMPDC